MWEGRPPAGWWPLASRRFLVTDTNVGARYAERIEPLAARIEVEPGEGAKTMAEAERVLRELARAGTTREDHIVAMGGGVVGGGELRDPQIRAIHRRSAR